MYRIERLRWAWRPLREGDYSEAENNGDDFQLHHENGPEISLRAY